MAAPYVFTGRLRDALVASDPGLLRLRLAGTATASMLAALGVMTGIARLTGQPVTAVLLGVIVSMVAAISVNDPEPGAQRLTTVLLPVPAAATVSLGTLLAGHRIAADVVFVAIMVVAVYVRRFGPRANALGQVGFQSYFFTQFLGARIEQLPWLVLALVVGTACTLLLGTVVFAQRPERTLRRTVAAFRARAAAVVDGVRDAVDTGRLPRPGGRPLRLKLARLNETALLVADILERTDAEQAWPGVPNRTLALRIFDAELTMDRLVAAAEQLVCSTVAADERAALLAALDRLRDGLGATAVPDPLIGRDGDSPARRLGAAIHRASLAMSDAGSREGPELPAIEEPVSADEPDRGAAAEPGLRPHTRQAIQVGVATSLAIVAGEFISPSRWYWAVITAFIVFTNTTSRGEILSRGWQRIVGTLAGVAAGIGVAVAVGGNTVAALITLFCCIFLGFYLLRVSQGLFMFWLTAVLALLYGLLGRFSIHVLFLRLEETAAGAAIGIAVAFLVLPSSTRATVSGHVGEFLSGLDTLLDAAVRDLVSGGDAGAQRLLARARTLDQTLRTLRTAARPLTTGLAGLGGRDGFRRTLRTLAATDRYARGLARLATQASESVSEPAGPALVRAADAVRANVRVLHALLGEPPERAGPVELTDATELLDAAEDLAPDVKHAAAVRFLRRLDGAVTGLAIDRGATRPTEPASAAASN